MLESGPLHIFLGSGSGSSNTNSFPSPCLCTTLGLVFTGKLTWEGEDKAVQVVRNPSVLPCRISRTPSARAAASCWTGSVQLHHSQLRSTFPHETFQTQDNFTARNHSIYCNNKMLYFLGIQGKMWCSSLLSNGSEEEFFLWIQKHSYSLSISFSQGNSLFYSWSWDVNHLQQQISTLLIFPSRWGTSATQHCSCLKAYQEAEKTTQTQLSQFSPRLLCTKPQDFTITTTKQWESHKVSCFLLYLWRLLIQALCLWNSHTIHLTTSQYVTTHPLRWNLKLSWGSNRLKVKVTSFPTCLLSVR